MTQPTAYTKTTNFAQDEATAKYPKTVYQDVSGNKMTPPEPGYYSQFDKFFGRAPTPPTAR